MTTKNTITFELTDRQQRLYVLQRFLQERNAVEILRTLAEALLLESKEQDPPEAEAWMKLASKRIETAFLIPMQNMSDRELCRQAGVNREQDEESDPDADEWQDADYGDS